MANKQNVSLLSKYQMRVLYYKCKEGATHEEIAETLGRDVNTVQYHMTRIYRILEIAGPAKSKEEMDSELKNEICPIIRQMFPTVDDVKTWAPSAKTTSDEEKEEPAPPYQPPPSLERVLRQAENQSLAPEINEPPPPGRLAINWWPIAIGLIIILAMIAGWGIYLHFSDLPRPTATPARPIPTQPLPLPELTVSPTIEPTITVTYTPMPSATPTPAPTPTEIVTQVSSKDGMVSVYVPAREFKMGSARAEDPQTLDEEIPQHNVFLDAYWIDQTEVTNAQYARCVADAESCTKPKDSSSLAHGSYYDNNQFANYPVIFVSWSQAAAYCTWAGRRLPTEAEWEKAARGPDGLIYPWGNTFDGTRANYCDINCNNGWKDNRYDDGYVDTSPVGDYPAGGSVYGALDMAGNVYEWVADWFEPYSRIMQVNPTGPLTGSEHIIRGGSWGDDPAHIRAAVRSHINVPDSSNFIGFRCAR
jgi:formylglycine-generating enzyme required for sulfatase activity/DNA-binding CsgD family transcriptional regulator